jgi:hypothetical protein
MNIGLRKYSTAFIVAYAEYLKVCGVSPVVSHVPLTIGDPGSILSPFI